MKARLFSFILYIVALVGLFSLSANSAFAATPCQVVYGGGEVCQGQKEVINTYQSSFQPTSTPTPTAVPVPHSTTTLPATGASDWAWVLIGVSGFGGVLLLLL